MQDLADRRFGRIEAKEEKPAVSYFLSDLNGILVNIRFNFYIFRTFN